MAERAPDQECIRFEDGTQWTWEEAIHQGYRAASVLADAGLERGNTMLLFLPNCAEWIRAWWGAAFLGAAIVPVNTANKGAFLGHVCEDSRAEIIVTDQNLATRLTEVEVDLRVIDAGSLALGDDREPSLSRPIEAWETEFINYTSGTTGPSKGVVTSYLHAAMSAYDSVGQVDPAGRLHDCGPPAVPHGRTGSRLWSLVSRRPYRVALGIQCDSLSRYLPGGRSDLRVHGGDDVQHAPGAARTGR